MNTAQVFELVQQPSAGERALAEMRAQFGRNGAASRWSRLPTRTRAVICYAAGLSTSFAQFELEQFDVEQREAIRAAMGALLKALHEFDGGVLHRSEWHKPASAEGASVTERKQAELENQRRAALTERAGALEGRIAALRKAAGNGQ